MKLLGGMEHLMVHAAKQSRRDRIRWQSSRAYAAARPSGIIVRKIGSFHRYAAVGLAMAYALWRGDVNSKYSKVASLGNQPLETQRWIWP